MKRGVLAALALVWLTEAGAAELPVKPSAIAGSWYPDDPVQVGGMIDRLLEAPPAHPEIASGQLRALISPHAGYQYSGATAAYGYRLLRGSGVRRVILIGPAHQGDLRGLSIPEVSEYQTPLGGVPLDQEAVDRLRASSLVGAWPEAHRYEHSLEIQLPFLQRVLEPGWTLVPILVGDLEAGEYAEAADLLRPLADERTLLIVSSDFTHYGPRFGYLPFPPDTKAAERLRDLDMGAFERIHARDLQGFSAYRRATGITVCGAEAVAILLALLPQTTRAELLDYATSGAMSGSYMGSVSYLCIAFLDDRPFAAPRSADVSTHEPGDLDPQQLRYLHRLARYAIEEAVDPGNGAREVLQQLIADLPEALLRRAGAFVTVRNGGELRGCKGYVEPVLPLYEAVIRNSVSAVLEDWRFPPVRAEELEHLELHISVLSVPVSISSYRDYRPGEDGIILVKDGHRGVFLPEVPTVAGWDRERTLEELAKKAGLAGDAWKDGAALLVFRTQVYHAPFE